MARRLRYSQPRMEKYQAGGGFAVARCRGRGRHRKRSSSHETCSAGCANPEHLACPARRSAIGGARPNPFNGPASASAVSVGNGSTMAP